MKQTTFNWLYERKDYILKKMGERYQEPWYDMLVSEIDKLNKDFNENIGYCGAGDDSCKHESISSRLVPDSKIINQTCWFHDRLYELVEKDKLTYKMADKILKYSGYYESTKQKTGFGKFKAVATSRVYYRGVQIRTFFAGIF